MLKVMYLSCNPEVPPHSYWDHGTIQHMFERFEHTVYELSEIPEDSGGAVVVIPARNQASDVEKINNEISKLGWCQVILTGDEESVFPWRELRHPNMRVWIMSPKIGAHDDAAFRIGSGFRYEQPQLLREVGYQDRSLDFFFAGQITHPIRQECAEQLRQIPNGRLLETHGFGQGMDHREYIDSLAKAKFIPSPSGPATPDNFRLYEALEAGCIPIADGGDYWPYLFGEEVPFPIVSKWSVLPGLMPALLKDWKHRSNVVFSWWSMYKRRMADKLEDQVTTLSGERPVRHGDDITVVIPTNATISAPSTELIERTIASVREQLPDSEIIVTFDGLKPEAAELKEAYDEYTHRMLWKMAHEYTNIVPIVFDNFSHQTLMMKEALKHVRTKFVLYVEHDAPLRGDIPWGALKEVVSSGYAHTIRFHHEDRILDEHKYLQLDDSPIEVLGQPLIRSQQYSQRPHLTTADHYRYLANTYFDDQPRFIEHVLYGVMLQKDWQEFRYHIYAPPGNMLRSWHLDGRRYTGE